MGENKCLDLYGLTPCRIHPGTGRELLLQGLLELGREAGNKQF